MGGNQIRVLGGGGWQGSVRHNVVLLRDVGHAVSAQGGELHKPRWSLGGDLDTGNKIKFIYFPLSCLPAPPTPTPTPEGLTVTGT